MSSACSLPHSTFLSMEAKPHCLDTAAHCPATCLWRTHTQLGKGTGPQSLRTPGSNTTGTHSFDLSCQSTELFHIFLFLGCVCVVRCRYHPAHDSALYWISRLSSLPWPWAPTMCCSVFTDRPLSNHLFVSTALWRSPQLAAEQAGLAATSGALGCAYAADLLPTVGIPGTCPAQHCLMLSYPPVQQGKR